MENISDLSANDLKKFARDDLGMNVPPGASKEQILKAIYNQRPDLQKEVYEAKEQSIKKEDDYEGPEKVTPVNQHLQKRVKILIHKSAEDKGDRDVIVGYNGRIYQIKRGEEVSVPHGVMCVLRDAVEDKYDWRADPRHPQGGEMVKRQVHAYPFSVIG